MLEQLLKYQEIDGKLRTIEQEISNSEEYKNYQTAKKFLEKAPEKLELLDKKADSLKAQLSNLNKKYIEITENVKDFESLDELLEKGGDVTFYKKNVASIVEELKSLKSEIKKISQNINVVVDDYSGLKKQTISTQKKYREYKEKFDEVKAGRSQERDDIKKELKKLAEKLGNDLLGKYNAKREEKMFPVICEVKEDRCGYCGMELSLAEKAKISSSEIIECDSCHRFLYKK